MSYKLVFENDDFLILNKSSGISFNDEEKLTGLFTELKINYTGIYSIHRLDKVTSGLIIIGKSELAAKEFGLLFSRNEIKKIYLAISDRKPKKKQGLVKGDMCKSRNGSWKLLQTLVKPAVTQFLSYSLKPSIRLYILKPHTGKTHQLRVAMKSLGAPILGDKLYAGTTSDRTYLHAYFLSFIFGGKRFEFTSLPDSGNGFDSLELKSKLNELGDPLELKWPVL